MKESDLDVLFDLLSDQYVMQYIEPPYTKEKTERFLKLVGLPDPPLIYSVDKNDCFIGYVIYNDYDEESIETGWVLNSKYWGNRYSSYLTEQLISWAFLAQKQVVIECSPQQEATKHLARKYGFKYVGNVDGLMFFD